LHNFLFRTNIFLKVFNIIAEPRAASPDYDFGRLLFPACLKDYDVCAQEGLTSALNPRRGKNASKSRTWRGSLSSKKEL